MIIKNPMYNVPQIGTSGSIRLLAGNWSNGTYTITLSALSTNCSIFLTPASAQDEEAVRQNRLYVTPQSQNGVISFTADTTPVSNIDFEFLIVKGLGASKVFMCGVYGGASTPPAPANQVTDQNGNPVTDENGNPVTAD